MRDSPSDGDVPQGGDDADGPEEDEDVVPLEHEVQGPRPVLVEHAGGLGARGAVGKCLWLTRVPCLVHVTRGRSAVLLLKINSIEIYLVVGVVIELPHIH